MKNNRIQKETSEFCVWEKASPSDETIWTYYPPCEGMTDLNNIDGFKFCPFCGKKMDLKLRP